MNLHPLFSGSLKAIRCFTALLMVMSAGSGLAHDPPGYEADPFRQLEEILPTPNSQRAPSGAPGERYWQQRADYRIEVSLDEDAQRLTGQLQLTYHNRSPFTLGYLWLQLDQNRFARHAEGHQSNEAPSFEDFKYSTLKEALARETFEGGFQIGKVEDEGGNALAHTLVHTMMRIDLPKPLPPKSKMVIHLGWTHQINDAKSVWGRGGAEYFEEDKNHIFEIAQWHPRVAAFTDVNGWQHKQFLGRGEFTLEFGDFEVAITVPADHVVAASGELQNPDKVLTEPQRQRLEEAGGSPEPVFVITPEEAKENEKNRNPDKATKTWRFRAENVRDFAWASSRKFIWDAARTALPGTGRKVWAMSYYPNEAEPLWSKYSTHAILHTLDVYSRLTFDYPYPVAISVNGPVYGMEYPMLSFNGPRPEDDGTYSKKTKYGLISVIIHEVGHNWFPMIVNSDERQWSWMDEGLNSFLQFVAEREWEARYPSDRGKPKGITGYMTSADQRPIMTNSESILQFGPNAYTKPATALNILRESVLGRELFDFAFREYSTRWMFKRPQPADFFRTMEDASGIDLDWFWRGWFYTTKHVDQAVGTVRLFDLETRDPDIDKPRRKEKRDEEDAIDLTEQANERAGIPRYTDDLPDLLDFYNSFDELEVTDADREDFKKLIEELEPDERRLLKTRRHFYTVEVENKGGLVMPIIMEIDYAGGSSETLRLPAEIWKKNPSKITKLILAKKEIRKITLDPNREIADANPHNNTWPQDPLEGTFQLKKGEDEKNPMQKAQEAADKDEDEDEDEDEGKDKDEDEGDEGDEGDEDDPKVQDDPTDKDSKDNKDRS
ncbi:M1 family metallopeptidase [soil metagenome]